jgi:hypothetical protein
MSGGVVGVGSDLSISEDITTNQEQIEGLIGKPKNTVFEKFGNPISCKIVDDSEFCVYMVSKLGYGAAIIIYPVPFLWPYKTDEVWMHCYCLEFGKDEILKRVEHEIVEIEEYHYPSHPETCYDQFDLPFSMP